jgi:hypothetical protein
MWKDFVQPVRSEMKIWRMRIAYWISKAKNTLSEYVTLIAFPLQKWLHERTSLLRYTYIVVLFYYPHIFAKIFQSVLLLQHEITVQGVRKRLYLFQKFVCLLGAILKILCPRERRVLQSKLGVSSSNECNLHHSPQTGHLGKKRVQSFSDILYIIGGYNLHVVRISFWTVPLCIIASVSEALYRPFNLP